MRCPSLGALPTKYPNKPNKLIYYCCSFVYVFVCCLAAWLVCTMQSHRRLAYRVEISSFCLRTTPYVTLWMLSLMTSRCQRSYTHHRPILSICSVSRTVLRMLLLCCHLIQFFRQPFVSAPHITFSFFAIVVLQVIKVAGNLTKF